MYELIIEALKCTPPKETVKILLDFLVKVLSKIAAVDDKNKALKEEANKLCHLAKAFEANTVLNLVEALGFFKNAKEFLEKNESNITVQTAISAELLNQKGLIGKLKLKGKGEIPYRNGIDLIQDACSIIINETLFHAGKRHAIIANLNSIRDKISKYTKKYNVSSTVLGIVTSFDRVTIYDFSYPNEESLLNPVNTSSNKTLDKAQLILALSSISNLKNIPKDLKEEIWSTINEVMNLKVFNLNADQYKDGLSEYQFTRNNLHSTLIASIKNSLENFKKNQEKHTSILDILNALEKCLTETNSQHKKDPGELFLAYIQEYLKILKDIEKSNLKKAKRNILRIFLEKQCTEYSKKILNPSMYSCQYYPALKDNTNEERIIIDWLHYKAKKNLIRYMEERDHSIKYSLKDLHNKATPRTGQLDKINAAGRILDHIIDLEKIQDDKSHEYKIKFERFFNELNENISNSIKNEKWWSIFGGEKNSKLREYFLKVRKQYITTITSMHKRFGGQDDLLVLMRKHSNNQFNQEMIKILDDYLSYRNVKYKLFDSIRGDGNTSSEKIDTKINNLKKSRESIVDVISGKLKAMNLDNDSSTAEGYCELISSLSEQCSILFELDPNSSLRKELMQIQKYLIARLITQRNPALELDHYQYNPGPYFKANFSLEQLKTIFSSCMDISQKKELENTCRSKEMENIARSHGKNLNLTELSSIGEHADIKHISEQIVQLPAMSSTENVIKAEYQVLVDRFNEKNNLTPSELNRLYFLHEMNEVLLLDNNCKDIFLSLITGIRNLIGYGKSASTGRAVLKSSKKGALYNNLASITKFVPDATARSILNFGLSYMKNDADKQAALSLTSVGDLTGPYESIEPCAQIIALLIIQYYIHNQCIKELVNDSKKDFVEATLERFEEAVMAVKNYQTNNKMVLSTDELLIAIVSSIFRSEAHHGNFGIFQQSIYKNDSFFRVFGKLKVENLFLTVGIYTENEEDGSLQFWSKGTQLTSDYGFRKGTLQETHSLHYRRLDESTLNEDNEADKKILEQIETIRKAKEDAKKEPDPFKERILAALKAPDVKSPLETEAPGERTLNM